MLVPIARSLVLLALAIALPTAAAEGSGCQSFKWSPTPAQALMKDTAGGAGPSGSVVKAAGGSFAVRLVPVAEAGLPHSAERPAPFSAWAKIEVLTASVYEIALSSEGWLDLIVDGAFLKAADFTGAKDCPGVRKMVRFALPAGLVTLQISGEQAREILVAIRATPPS